MKAPLLAFVLVIASPLAADSAERVKMTALFKGFWLPQKWLAHAGSWIR